MIGELFILILHDLIGFLIVNFDVTSTIFRSCHLQSSNNLDKRLNIRWTLLEQTTFSKSTVSMEEYRTGNHRALIMVSLFTFLLFSTKPILQASNPPPLRGGAPNGMEVHLWWHYSRPLRGLLYAIMDPSLFTKLTILSS